MFEQQQSLGLPVAFGHDQPAATNPARNLRAFLAGGRERAGVSGDRSHVWQGGRRCSGVGGIYEHTGEDAPVPENVFSGCALHECVAYQPFIGAHVPAHTAVLHRESGKPGRLDRADAMPWWKGPVEVFCRQKCDKWSATPRCLWYRSAVRSQEGDTRRESRRGFALAGDAPFENAKTVWQHGLRMGRKRRTPTDRYCCDLGARQQDASRFWRRIVGLERLRDDRVSCSYSGAPAVLFRVGQRDETPAGAAGLDGRHKQYYFMLCNRGERSAHCACRSNERNRSRETKQHPQSPVSCVFHAPNTRVRSL